MDQLTIIIKFEDVSIADANRYASELRHALLNATPNIKVEQRRDDPRTQDFGATLVLILGTSSVTALVTAIGNWLLLRNSASLTFETPEGKVLVRNITSNDAAKLAEQLIPKK